MPQYGLRTALARRLAGIASEAGVVLDCLQKAGCRSALKGDGSPVSEADIAAEVVISRALAEAFPDIPVVSEENAASHVSGEMASFFLVDPLDGTTAYLAGAPDYCVLIALIENGTPVASAIHSPATGQSWWAGEAVFAAENRAFSNPRALEIKPAREGGGIAIISSHHANAASRALCQSLHITEIIAENSALKFVRLAEGEADFYPRVGRTMQWDIAAGDALLRAMGGGVFDLQGRPFRYGAGPDGWANPDFLAIRRQPDLDHAA
ncbi:MAG: 3'(2'),5'-bisphosphate nucleotidase CysQ [Rhizobiales bacterium PAR1]|nr:MAG: 3'(2'),5'-bisphosphate nucleotidase CysQ [Rhizobiales bacterium PAR1]